jgi:hypothetical protein
VTGSGLDDGQGERRVEEARYEAEKWKITSDAHCSVLIRAHEVLLDRFDGLNADDKAEDLARLLSEFDAWLSLRGEFGEVLTAFRSAFGTDTSAAAIEATTTTQQQSPEPASPEEECDEPRCGESFPGQITLKHDGAQIFTAPCPKCTPKDQPEEVRALIERRVIDLPASAPSGGEQRRVEPAGRKPIIKPGKEWEAARAVVGAEIADPAGFLASNLLHRVIDAVEAVRYADVKPRRIVDRPEG